MSRRSEQENKYKYKNLCTTFILPMCGINKKTLPKNFNNSYITKDYDVILAFDKTHDYNDIFLEFLEYCKKSSSSYTNYEEDIDEILIFFKISEVFKEDFDLFIEGKYSKFSNKYKEILTSFYGIVSIKDNYRANVINAIFPEDFKRKQIADRLSTEKSKVDWKLIHEVLDKPNLDKEIYKELSIILKQKEKII